MAHTSHANHANHVNYSDPNTGAPISLTWAEWSGDTMPEDLIQETEAKIKELRDKIDFLHEKKGPWTDGDGPNLGQYDAWSYIPDNPIIDLSPVNDASFDGQISEAQYDALRDSLNILYVYITGSTDVKPGNGSNSGLPDRAAGDKVYKTDFENIKIKIDDLAEYDASANHQSHHNHAR